MSDSSLVQTLLVLSTLGILAQLGQRSRSGPLGLYRNQPGWQLQGLCTALAAASGASVVLVRLWVLLLFVCAPTTTFLIYLLGSLLIPWSQRTPATTPGVAE